MLVCLSRRRRRRSCRLLFFFLFDFFINFMIQINNGWRWRV